MHMTQPIVHSTGPASMGRRDWLNQSLALASACLLPCLSACDSPSESLDKLTIAHAYQASFGLLYVAEKAGFIKAEGLEVQFKRYSFGRETLLATLDGEGDIATPFDTPVALAILQNAPVRVLSSLSVLLGNAQVLANKQRGIRTPADLKGRRIGYIPNTSGEYILSMVLANAGIDEQQVNLLPLKSPDELSQALVRGDVDAAALWAPFTHTIATELGAKVLEGFTSPTYVETALLTTTENTLRKKTRAIKKLMTALIKAQNLVLRDPASAVQYIQSALPEIPAPVIARSWASLQPQVRLDNQLVASLGNQILWFRKKQHQAQDASVNVRSRMADEILRAVQPQAVTLKHEQ